MNSSIAALKQQVNGLCSRVEVLQELVLGLQQNYSIQSNAGQPSWESPHHDDLKNSRRPHPESGVILEETLVGGHLHERSYQKNGGASASGYLSHKDILPDHELVDSHWNSFLDCEVSPQIQIRRLTSQLTAAYQRIAELEEQIINQRENTSAA